MPRVQVHPLRLDQELGADTGTLRQDSARSVSFPISPGGRRFGVAVIVGVSKCRPGQRHYCREAAQVGGAQADVAIIEPGEIAGDGKTQTRAGLLRVPYFTYVEDDLVGLGRQPGPVSSTLTSTAF